MQITETRTNWRNVRILKVALNRIYVFVCVSLRISDEYIIQSSPYRLSNQESSTLRKYGFIMELMLLSYLSCV